MDKSAFLQKYGRTEEEFSQTGLDWSLLMEVRKLHLEMLSELQTTATYVSDRLQAVPEVHSIKVRIKDVEHLIEKIIRKKLQRPDLQIDCTSYQTCITDLIGVRALHLFKDDWRTIHEFVSVTWDLHEEPIAYVRKGDPTELLQSFKEAGCRVEEHEFGYRSIHYVIESKPAKCTRRVELQVRTIFEEGWSEIDHRVRYPRQSDNPYLTFFLNIFNRLAGQADEMGTFTKALAAYILEQVQTAADAERQLQAKEAELREAVSRLKISEEEKAGLEKRIGELRTSLPIPALSIPALNLDIPPITVSVFKDSNMLSVMTGNSLKNMFSTQKTCSRCGKHFEGSILEVSLNGTYCDACKNDIKITVGPIG